MCSRRMRLSEHVARMGECNILVGRPEGKRPLGRPGRRWEDIRTDPREIAALGPIQPPTQWVRGALSVGVKRPRREADHSPPSNAEVKNA
jgi:hypothetical protein